MSTHGEIDRAERMIVAMVDLAEAIDGFRQTMNGLGQLVPILEQLNANLKTPSPGWRRMLDEFKGAVSRIPTTLRARF